MRLFTLSEDTNKPCYVLKFKDTQVMLDCSLNLQTMMHFMPVSSIYSKEAVSLGVTTVQKSKVGVNGNVPCDIKESGGHFFFDSEPLVSIPEVGGIDLSLIDAVLISNYMSMLALPYITEDTGFRGTVYATEPAIQTGRHLMEELILYLGHSNRHHKELLLTEGSICGVPAELLAALSSNYRWRRIFTQETVNACLAKVHCVAYNEKNNVFGLVNIIAISSGFSIGSCNWIIDSDYERVTYLAGSSTLTTHPRPLEHLSLKRSDVMILTNLTRSPLNNPDSMIGEFCVAAAVTLKKGGNVLIPCLPCGVTFDMFECLAAHLRTCNLSHIPMYFISGRAEASLAYSNIYAEWLTSSKTANVYLPDAPFQHAELLKSGRLRTFPHIHGEFNDVYRTPCVIFAGHPSLRGGDVTHFLMQFAADKHSSIIFTDPDVNYLEALAPYQPVNLRVVYCPIDTRLSYTQANKLIRELKPKHLVVPKVYTVPPTLQPGRTDLVIEPFQSNLLTHDPIDELILPVRRKFVTVEMDPKLAEDMVPFEIKSGIAVAQLSGQLKNNNNLYTIEPLGIDIPRTKRRKAPKPILYGTLNVNELKRNLSELGISDVKIEDSGGTIIIEQTEEGWIMQLEENSIHIACDDEAVRVKIRDATLKSLQKIDAAKTVER